MAKAKARKAKKDSIMEILKSMLAILVIRLTVTITAVTIAMVPLTVKAIAMVPVTAIAPLPAQMKS
jgi:hypothetical protein